LFKNFICHGKRWHPEVYTIAQPLFFKISFALNGLKKISLPLNFRKFICIDNQTIGYHKIFGLVTKRTPPGFKTLTISCKDFSGEGVCSIHSEENMKEKMLLGKFMSQASCLDHLQENFLETDCANFKKNKFLTL